MMYSVLPDGAVMVEDEGRRGSPAEKATIIVPPARRKKRRKGATFLFGLIHLALIYVMGYILILSALPAIGLVGYALYVAGPLWGVAVAFASVPISILWYMQVVIFVKRFAIGRIRPGTYDLHSLRYLRCWFLSYLMNNTRNIVLPLYATLFLPRFLRQLGAKVGRMVEISTIMHAIPDLLEIDDGSFLADACIVGGPRIYGGKIEIQANKIGKRTFVGNSAHVPAGVDLGNNGLVGVMSTPPSGTIRTADGTSLARFSGFCTSIHPAGFLLLSPSDVRTRLCHDRAERHSGSVENIAAGHASDGEHGDLLRHRLDALPARSAVAIGNPGAICRTWAFLERTRLCRRA